MKRSVVARLQDILVMIDAAADMVRGRSFSDYRSNIQLRLAIERCVEVVSEVSHHIPADQKVNLPDAPWPKIAGIGNKLRHEYNRVDDHILWRIATGALPKLRPTIVRI